MGLYKQIRQEFIKEYKDRNDLYRERLAKWNAESPIVRVEKPLNVSRARKLGYRDKQGVIIFRVRVKGGKKKRVPPHGGRKPSKSGRFFSRVKSTQAIAEERASRKAMNCEVLNSYFVGRAGSYIYYEVIALDRNNSSIMNDPKFADMIKQRGRAFRGLTSAGKKHRNFGEKHFNPTKEMRTRVRQSSRL